MMWIVLVCVIAIVLVYVMGSFAGRADLRDELEARDKGERDRDSGALPYDYVSPTKRRK